MIDRAFLEYFCPPANLSELPVCGNLSRSAGYFRFGETTCYGKCSGAAPAENLDGCPPEVLDAVGFDDGRPSLPFDLSEVVTNLREERYRQSSQNIVQVLTASSLSRRIYYSFRPFLPVAVRKHLQRVRLSGWRQLVFPRWPVDVTVETLMQRAMAIVLKTSGLKRIPFIWFWPDGARGCAIVTHDVEGPVGEAFCDELMDIDESSGVRSSFQIVPELRYKQSWKLADRLRGRGFEVNVHDLNHDGHLFHTRQQFLKRATQINRYARELGSRGFRSGCMFRDQRWFDALDVSFDMSVPNVAHLEPQQGGCCTVMPHFVGKILELPLTTIQDYSLFHILGDYSSALWKEQASLILAKNGLVSFLTHPDYLIEERALVAYRDLLTHLQQLGGEVWSTLPADVDRWWRNRSQMKLIPDGDLWRVSGPDSGRARVAYATLDGDRVVYEWDSRRPHGTSSSPLTVCA